MNWYFEALKKYAVFSGRARRKEYWIFLILNVIITLVLFLVEMLIGISGTLVGLYSLAVIIPSLAVLVRRLHDTGRSGWWLFINFIPLIGGIILLVFILQNSQPNANQYGPNPKGTTAQ